VPEVTELEDCFEKLFHSGKEADHFNFDSYDWGCLQYMLKLWFFLNKRRTEGIDSTSSFFSFVHSWLTANEELDDDIFLQMICTLDGDKTPGKSTLNDDIKRYKEEELRKAYRTIIQWMRLPGL
jgi:hypothetical protein